MFLCIKNPGVAPIEGYLLLGVSTTRDCGVSGTIGQFGSGSKHAINILLRAGLKLVIYCGEQKMEFLTRDEIIDDGLSETSIKRVVCKLTGPVNKIVDTGWALDFGLLDWKEISMALREFVSNAIDRTVREEGNDLKNTHLSITTVEKSQAIDGFTQVFVEMNEDVLRFFGELPRRFLHFCDNPELTQTILPKANRSLNGRSAMIYREGVFVREMKDSLFDYNFTKADFTVDESRNSSDYIVKAKCAGVLREASVEIIQIFLKSLIRQEENYETLLPSEYLCWSYNKPTKEERENWQNAWQAVAGDGILCASGMDFNFIQRKGKKAVSIKSSGLVEVLDKFGIPTALTVLSQLEKKGLEKLSPTDAAVAAVDTVWQWLGELNLLNGKEKPRVGCFRQLMEAGQIKLGFCDNTGVYFADDHASGISNRLLQTALEELTHWITGADDESRDFQEYLLRVVVEMKTGL